MFGPPEVITGRLMSGAGAAPMVAASGEFTAAAVAYEVSIDRLTMQLSTLMTTWQGLTATAMQRAVLRFIVWMRMLQTQVVTSAARTGAQAAAFTEAYTTMAQMVEIVENRVTTQVLHATNFLGMNAIPIGVKEGQYVEMWLRDVAVQTNYLAQTIANTTYEPFLPPAPITVGLPAFPPVVNQALNAALSATDRVRMAAYTAQNTASQLQAQLGSFAATAGIMAMRGQGAAEKAEAQAAIARNREQQLQNQTADKATQQMGQQLVQQIPQQAASIGQQVAQLPQQALQQVQSIGQQFGSQISSLMSQVAPEHRLDNPGFYDTHPSSTTLDRLAGSSGPMALTAAVRVPSLAGLSAPSTGFRFPSGWDGALPGAMPPSAPAAPSAGGPLARGMGAAMPLRGGTNRDDDDGGVVKRPETELTALWGDSSDEPETISAGQFATPKEEAAT